MTKPKRMTDDEIGTLVDAEISDAQNYRGALSAARKKNLSYFLGLAVGDLAPPEVEGRSAVVDPVVRNTVLGMEAPLIKTFCGTDNVVEFSATTEDDEEKAKQATDYVNHIFRKKNPGYLITSTWIRDSLVQKVGYVAVWWDDSEIESNEEYRGQTAEQLAILFDDDEVEPTASKPYPDPEAEKAKAKQLEQMQPQLETMMAQAAQGQVDPQMVQQAMAQFEQFQAQPVPMLYDVSVKRTKKGGRIRVENIPPEEMLVSRRCKTLDDDTFKGRRLRRTINQLRAQGYKNVDAISSDDSADLNDEAATRDYLGDNMRGGADIDPGQREVWISECYVHADFDATGVAEWRKIVRAGGQLLENEPCDGHPFGDLCAIPLPHQHVGMCPADLAIEPQRVSTALLRSQLDNVYLQVNGRYFAKEGAVNLDDLLRSRPGGIVRIKEVGAVGRLDQAMGDTGRAMELMEMYQTMTEEATGWTRQSSGGNGLALDSTATQANIVTNRADSRIEIISRQYAETGFTWLYKRILKLITQHQDKAEQVKLGNKWVNIDPREWINQFDLTINVGLGTGNKDQQVQHLMALSQQQQLGLAIGTTSPKNVYNAQVKFAETLGFKNGGEQFFTDPDAPPDPNAPPKPPPPPDPAIVKAQMDQQAHQAEIQFKQQSADADRQHSAELERFKADMQMQTDRNRQEVEAQQKQLEMEQAAQLEALKEQYRNEEAREALQLDMAKMELERYKIDQDNQTKIVLAQIAAKQAGDAALIAAEAAANTASAKGSANGND